MLGWNPKYDLSAILDDFLAWVESIGGIPVQIEDAYGAMRRAGVVLRNGWSLAFDCSNQIAGSGGHEDTLQLTSENPTPGCYSASFHGLRRNGTTTVDVYAPYFCE